MLSISKLYILKFRTPTYYLELMVRWLDGWMVMYCLTIQPSSHPTILFILFSSVLLPSYAQTTFIEKAQEVGIDHYFQNGNLMGGGAAVFDFNNDGWEDIWINGGSHREVLYQNNKNGTFKEVGGLAGLGNTANYRTTSVIAGDIDNDGLRDVFITTREDTPNLLFRNNGDGTFTEITEKAGLSEFVAWSTTAAFADINLDGYIDIYVGNYVEEFGYLVDRRAQILSGYDHECQPNFLFLNQQDGTFKEVGASLHAADEGCALASAFTDFDNDGDMDLMVVNDYGQWVIPNTLLINQQLEMAQTTFTEIDSSSNANVGMYAMGVAIGDYDKDQDLDYYITNIGRNALLQNMGDGTFVDTTRFAGVEDTYADSNFTVGWGTDFLDVDNDADLDLFVANGFISALSFNKTSLKNPDRLFLNQGYSEEKGGVTFIDESAACGIGDSSTARGLAKGDFDNDGDLDIVVTRVSGTSSSAYVRKILYYENQLNNTYNWLKIKVKRKDNQEVFGTHLRIVIGADSWLSEINGGSSHASQHSSIAHFGLGTATHADSLIINFLGGGQLVYTDISANQELEVLEENAVTTSVFSNDERNVFSIKVQPNPFNAYTIVSFDNPNAQTFSIQLFDVVGLPILRKETTNNQVKIERKNMPTGIYFIKVINENGGSRIEKIILQNW